MKLPLTKTFLVLSLIFFISSRIIFSQPVTQVFKVDPTYDFFGRDEVKAALIFQNSASDFYIDETYYNALEPESRQNIAFIINELGFTYQNNILVRLRGFLETDLPKVTVVLTTIKKRAGGYFNYGVPDVINLNTDFLFDRDALSKFFIHELGHFISFHLKEKMINKLDDIWLNELRAEWLASYFGYKDDYKYYPIYVKNDSLREWNNGRVDYAAINLFKDFLEKRFGSDFLKKLFIIHETGQELFNKTLLFSGSSFDLARLFMEFIIELYNTNSIGANSYITLSSSKPVFKLDFSLKDTQGYLVEILNPQNVAKLSLMVDGDVNKGSFLNIAIRKRLLDGSSETEYHEVTPGRAIIIDSSKAGSIFLGLFLFTAENFTEKKTIQSKVLSVELKELKNYKTSITDGSLIKLENSDLVYIVKGQYKRPISREILPLYGHLREAAVYELPQDTIETFITSNLIQRLGDSRVFEIIGNQKKWIENEAIFYSRGFEFNQVYIVNDLEFNYYAG